ncbi:MFS transporter [Arthrobacter sp. MMS18-M83]|uniref:MFS transporter n=1 Tax=Arthrobacter sp. MMS18-M83 TaxID=2996261 RepID=UPI00227C114D|nr:MFS transporter [Arthrobacter sp. MMS18-M83]WAH97550.1 MFS transporter [Arthrobacter sp. MMS18-M83]
MPRSTNRAVVTVGEVRAASAGVIALAAVSGVRFSYGVILPGLSAQLNSTVLVLAMPFTVHWLVFTLTAPLAWRVFALYGTRFMFIAGGVLCGLGMAALPLVASPIEATLTYGILVGLGTHGLGQMAANHPVLMISDQSRRDRLFGVVACGAPVGTAAYPAISALVTDATGWRVAAVVVGATVVGTSLFAARLLPSRYPRRGLVPGVHTVTRARARATAPWREASFLLLCAAFFTSLLVQTAVPVLLPVWGAGQGFSAAQLAIAFTIMGSAGLVGRFVMTGTGCVFGRQLWAVVPVGLLGVSGFVVAVFASNEWWLYIAVLLLGFSTPVFGALFAVATLACFPPERYAQISGALLVPVGIGAAISGLIPGLAVDHTVPFALIWLVLAGMLASGSVLFLVAERISPVYRAQLVVSTSSR